MWKNLTRL